MINLKVFEFTEKENSENSFNDKVKINEKVDFIKIISEKKMTKIIFKIIFL